MLNNLSRFNGESVDTSYELLEIICTALFGNFSRIYRVVKPHKSYVAKVFEMGLKKSRS